jgi:hypothetical protein
MKKRRLRILLAVLALGSVGRGWAQVAASAGAAPDVSVTATVAAVSNYMFRGLRLSDGGLQPQVEVAAGNLIVGAWGNVPFNGDKVPGSSDPEIDLYGVYNIGLEGGLTLTPGFTLYHFPKASTNAGFYRNTFEPSLALSYIVDGVKLTPKVYYDVVLKGPTYELTAFYALPLTRLGSELDFTATYGGYKWRDTANDASPEVKAWGQYWHVGVAAPFQISFNSRITLGIAYTEGRQAYTKAGTSGKIPNSLSIGRGVATVSYTLTF